VFWLSSGLSAACFPMDDDFNDLGDWDGDYFERVDRIIAAHRIYMEFFGQSREARLRLAARQAGARQ
jgi:hypothetical protein